MRAGDKTTRCGEEVDLIGQGGGRVEVVVLAGLLLLQLMRGDGAEDGVVEYRDG